MNICRSTLAIACVLAFLNACTKIPDTQAPPAPASTRDDAENSFAGVTLDVEAQQRLGLEFAHVTSTLANAVARGTAVVIDGAALAATQADLESSRDEVAAARENLDRLQKLYAEDGNASRQAVDAARTQWAAARARWATAEAKMRSDWGARIVGVPGTSGKLLDDVASGRALLLRAEFAGTLPAAVEQLQYSLLAPDPDDNVSPAVEFLGRSHAPAQIAAGPSVLLRIAPSNRDSGLRPGERLSIIAASRSVSARPVVPAGAVFADGGRFWCYVAREGGRFDRVPLLSTERVAEGYPVSAGAKEGDRVVVRGAPLLLSLERGAGSVADEE